FVDRLLNFGRCPPSGWDRAGVRHCYVAVGVHYLVRQRHEVAGSRAGVAWDEQPTRGLKNRDAHYVTDAKRDPPRQWCMGLRRVGPASSFCRSVISAAALVHKTRISRSRESEDYSDSSCGGEDNGARLDHHRNNSSTRSGGVLVCRAHRFYHPARVEKSAKVVPGSTLATARPLSVDRIGALGPTRFIQFSRRFRNPTTCTAGCCARAVSGHAAAAPPMIAMKARRFTA